jgi:hypothetical protein
VSVQQQGVLLVACPALEPPGCLLQAVQSLHCLHFDVRCMPHQHAGGCQPSVGPGTLCLVRHQCKQQCSLGTVVGNQFFSSFFTSRLCVCDMIGVVHAANMADGQCVTPPMLKVASL